MRVAIIDLGTNSVRFDVHEFRARRVYQTLHREKLMIRLGQGVFSDGRLDRRAVLRALSAFRRFKRVSEELEADKIVAFGTSALRDAADSGRFIRMVRRETGIELRVISGSEEARLIALGVLANDPEKKGRFALVDIGGGSTEISICRGKKVLHSHSFPLGTARLQQLFLRRAPPSSKAIEALRSHIHSVLLEVMRAEKWPKVDRIVGSSGTIRAISRMLRKRSGKALIEREPLAELVARLSAMTHQQIAQVPGIEPKRVDMIVAGSILFEEVMAALGAKTARATEYSLRDGILEEELRLFKRGLNAGA